MSYVKYALAAVGALALFAGTQQANALTLQDLITNGTPVVHGDVIYSNFGSDNSLPASNVFVNFTATGVQFTGNWNTVTPLHDHIDITYNVAVDPQVGGTITGSGLDIRGVGATGGAVASVGETLQDVATNHVYQMSVFSDGSGPLVDKYDDSVTFSPEVTSLNINKSIDLASNGDGSFASLNFVENTYVSNPNGGGNPPVVPEPMSLALLPLALVGLGLRKKLAR